jgi:hypothetical protein
LVRVRLVIVPGRIVANALAGVVGLPPPEKVTTGLDVYPVPALVSNRLVTVPERTAVAAAPLPPVPPFEKTMVGGVA